MFGRQVAVLLRVRQPALHSQKQLSFRVLLSQPRRHYAIPGRPKKAVGEPSKTVKRAVKKAAKEPVSFDATTQEPAVAKPARTKKIAAKKPAKKPAAKKPAKKPSAKKRKEVAVKRPVKKVLTDEQLLSKRAKAEKEAIKQAKLAVLSPPKVGYSSAWLVFMRERSSELYKSEDRPTTGQAYIGALIKDACATWKELSASEMEVRRDDSAHSLRGSILILR